MRDSDMARTNIIVSIGYTQSWGRLWIDSVPGIQPSLEATFLMHNPASARETEDHAPMRTGFSLFVFYLRLVRLPMTFDAVVLFPTSELALVEVLAFEVTGATLRLRGKDRRKLVRGSLI